MPVAVAFMPRLPKPRPARRRGATPELLLSYCRSKSVQKFKIISHLQPHLSPTLARGQPNQRCSISRRPFRPYFPSGHRA